MQVPYKPRGLVSLTSNVNTFMFNLAARHKSIRTDLMLTRLKVSRWSSPYTCVLFFSIDAALASINDAISIIFHLEEPLAPIFLRPAGREVGSEV
jgi:hypothetical protein